MTKKEAEHLANGVQDLKQTPIDDAPKTAAELVAQVNQLPMPNETPASDDRLAEFAGEGFEGVRVEDQTIPFLRILQANSPQCKRDSGITCREGDVFNTVEQSVFNGEQGVNVIPVRFTPRIIEWKPRAAGGGFIAAHPYNVDLSGCERNERRVWVNPSNGHEFVETAEYACIQLLPEDDFRRVVIAFTSTQIRKSRALLTVASQITVRTRDGRRLQAPLYSTVYSFTTVPESNELGEWNGWRIMPLRRVNENELELARSFHASLAAGAPTANYAQMEPEPSGVDVGAADMDSGVQGPDPFANVKDTDIL